MFNLDDYVNLLRKQYNTSSFNVDVRLGWCYGQKDSFRILYHLDIISIGDYDYLCELVDYFISKCGGN